jgi:hypothetical protein
VVVQVLLVQVEVLVDQVEAEELAAEEDNKIKKSL